MYKTAIEARKDLDRLYKEIKLLRYNPDLYHFHKNLDMMVTELSNLIGHVPTHLILADIVNIGY